MTAVVHFRNDSPGGRLHGLIEPHLEELLQVLAGDLLRERLEVGCPGGATAILRDPGPGQLGTSLPSWWLSGLAVVLAGVLGVFLARPVLWASVEFGRRGSWWYLSDHRGVAVVRIRNRPKKRDRFADSLSAVPTRQQLGRDLMRAVVADAPTPVRARAVKKTAEDYAEKWGAEKSDKRVLREGFLYRVEFSEDQSLQ